MMMRGVWQKIHWWEQNWLKLECGGGEIELYEVCMWWVLNALVGMCCPLVFTKRTHLESVKPFSTGSFKGHQQIHLLHLYANICVRKCVWISWDFQHICHFSPSFGYCLCTCDIHFVPARIIRLDCTLEKTEKWNLEPVNLCETEPPCPQQ